MTTPLLSVFQKRINDSFEQLDKNQVTPWAFMAAGPPFRIQTHDKRQISYQGILFEGSPRNVFWARYIEPFMEEICINEIDAAVQMAKDRHVDGALLLLEIKDLLLAGIRQTYFRMADIDRRLRGKGYPKSVGLRGTDKEYVAMTYFVDARIRSELRMWKPKSNLQVWYEDNKAVVWAIGAIFTALGLIVKFL
jgi:hypothetical protein